MEYHQKQKKCEDNGNDVPVRLVPRSPVLVQGQESHMLPPSGGRHGVMISLRLALAGSLRRQYSANAKRKPIKSPRFATAPSTPPPPCPPSWRCRRGRGCAACRP